MSAGGWYEEFVNLSLAARTAATTAFPFRSGPAKGALFTIYVKTAGTGNLQFRTAAIEIPENQGWVPTALVTMTVAGIYYVICHPGAAMQPPGEVADTTNGSVVLQTAAILAPDRWRSSFLKSDGSSWVWGCTARRLP